MVPMAISLKKNIFCLSQADFGLLDVHLTYCCCLQSTVSREALGSFEKDIMTCSLSMMGVQVDLVLKFVYLQR